MEQSTLTQTPLLTASPTPVNAGEARLSPALVREVAQKVYALFLRDLRLERERLGAHSRARTYGQGGYG